MKKSIFLRLMLCLAVAFSLFSLTSAQAQTDDAGVLDGAGQKIDIFTFMRMYQYRQAGSTDMYLSKDNCVLVTFWNTRLSGIFLLAPGYKTDKGIEVGMTINDIEEAYGPIYLSNDEPRNFKKKYGVYYSYSKYSKKYSNYDSIEYVSPKNEGINFVIDKRTGRIVLIMYMVNRHGNGTVMGYAEMYKLLPVSWWG